MRSSVEANQRGDRTWAVRSALEGAFLLLLTMIVLVQSNAGTRSLERDQGFYVYIGSEIIHGRLPYADAWESKPPAIFYLNALGLWLTHGSRWGVWVLEIAAVMLASYVGFELLKRQWGILPALFGTGLWLYGLDGTFFDGGNFTEEYPLALHFLSILVMMQLLKAPAKRLYSTALGVFFAIAFLFRPNNAALEAAVILTVLLAWVYGKRYREMAEGLACMAIGAAVCFLIPVVYFWSKGLLRDLIDASILYHTAYAAASSPSFRVLANGLASLGMGVPVAGLGYILMLYETLKRSENRFLYIFVLIGWPITILVTDPADKGFAHYYINWLPFVALLSAFTLAWLQSHIYPRQTTSINAEWAALGCSFAIAIAVFVFTGRAAEYGRMFNRIGRLGNRGSEFRTATAIYAQDHTTPGEYVLFWSVLPGENYMAERESPTSALYYPAYFKSDISAQLSDRFLRDLTAKKPVLIIDMDDPRGLSLDPTLRRIRLEAGVAEDTLPDNIYQVFAYIDNNYHLETIVKNKRVYRLNGTG